MFAGNSKMAATVYNVIQKENSVALCKADQVPYDLNGDDKITLGECTDLKTIILNSEEAIKESYDEKFARIQAELEAKNAGLTSQIIDLQKQQQSFNTQQLQTQIDSLNAELKTTKSMLDAVIAKDKNVVNTIDNNEQFNKPNFIVQFLDSIIAWIKGLFT